MKKSKKENCNYKQSGLLWITFILVLLLSVKVFFNPHYEEKEYIKGYDTELFGAITIDAEVNMEKDCICTSNSVIYPYSNYVSGDGDIECACKQFKRVLRFGKE